MKAKYFKYAAFAVTIIALSFFRAVASYVFIFPNGFAPGGVSGIASILYNAILPSNPRLAETVFNPSLVVFVLNAPLLVLAFLKINRKYAAYTAVCVTLYSLFMALFSLVGLPQFIAGDYDSSVMMLAAIAGGVISGVSLGFMFLSNMSAGGSEIVTKLIHAKNPAINYQWLIFIVDSVVVLASGILGIISIQKGETASAIFVKILTPIFYSFISMFVTSKIADLIHTGVELSVVFNINTTKSAEISDEIVNKLHRGATIMTGEGYYTHSERKIVVCVVRKKQLQILKKLVFKIDPEAFIYITNTREVNGYGFKKSQ